MTSFLTLDITYFPGKVGVLWVTEGRVVNDNPTQSVWAVYSEYHFEFMNSLPIEQK